jgi:hypothetical protein
MPRARRMARRRGVARVAVGSAVVAGTAGAVHHHQNKKWAEQDGADDTQNQQNQVEENNSNDYMQELEKLGELHEKGILTDEEFAAKKKQILG